jgi:hypothetical protein
MIPLIVSTPDLPVLLMIAAADECASWRFWNSSPKIGSQQSIDITSGFSFVFRNTYYHSGFMSSSD